MLHIIMNEVRTSTSRFPIIIIPGGWRAKVMELRIAPEDLRLHLAVVAQEFEGDVVAAQKSVIEAVQLEYGRARVRNLRKAVMRWAQKYAKLAPRNARRHVFANGEEYVLLKGFNPEALQGYFVPGDNVGRRGKPLLMQALRAQAKRAKEGW